MIIRTFYQGYFIHSLSTLYYYNAPSLTTRLTGDYRDRTCTGKCGPALLDTPNKKVIHHFANHFYNSYLYQISFFRTFTYRIYCGLGYKHESSQVQYRNALSVKILAKISPSGSATIIRSAAANQEADTDKDMIPRL